MVNDILNGTVEGIALGCVYAIVALGLVLTYKTSGVFNLAYGAQAFIAAVAYFDTHTRHGWPIWLAVLFAVFLVSPLVGLILDRALFRYLRNASPTAKLVTVLGLIVALPQAVTSFWVKDSDLGRAFGIVPGGDVGYNIVGTVNISRDQIMTIVVTTAVALGSVRGNPCACKDAF